MPPPGDSLQIRERPWIDEPLTLPEPCSPLQRMRLVQLDPEDAQAPAGRLRERGRIGWRAVARVLRKLAPFSPDRAPTVLDPRFHPVPPHRWPGQGTESVAETREI